jgi:hypothetical protein
MLVTESYEIQSIEIDGDTAVAVVSMHTRLDHPRLSDFDRQIVTQDKWVRLDGEWRRDKQTAGLRQMFRKIQEKLHPGGDSAPPGAAPGEEAIGDGEGGGEEGSARESIAPESESAT